MWLTDEYNLRISSYCIAQNPFHTKLLEHLQQLGSQESQKTHHNNIREEVRKRVTMTSERKPISDKYTNKFCALAIWFEIVRQH